MKNYTNPAFVRRSTQNMTNKTCANWLRELKGDKKHHTNLAFVRRSTQNMANKLKMCGNWGRGRGEIKSTTENRSLRRKKKAILTNGHAE